MCRWPSYSGARIFLETLLFKPEFSLIAQDLHACKAAVAHRRGDIMAGVAVSEPCA
jgi:hypothetical protein